MMTLRSEAVPDSAKTSVKGQALVCVALTDMASGFERRGVGIIALDADNDIVLISPLARQMMTHCGIAVVGNRILATDNEETREILKLIGQGAPQMASAVLSCPETNQWLVVHSGIAPIITAPDAPPAWYRVLSLRDPSQVFDQDVDTMSRLLGLTRRESELACHLAAGRALTEFAEMRHVTLNTVRSHLKRVYRKVGVTNQAELVARALAVLR